MEPMFNQMPKIWLPISDRTRNVYLPIGGWLFILVTPCFFFI